MRLIVAASVAATLLAGPTIAQAHDAAPRWAIAIHGGAGVIERGQLSSEREAEYRAALTAAVQAGSDVLEAGGTALDAVQAAIELMEDDPLFNAGRGAVFTAEGTNSLDAAIMDGETLSAGSVAGVSSTRHPIALARAVMEQSGHVMLAGEGADAFAIEAGLEQVEPAWFFTERRWGQLVQTLTQRGWAIPDRPQGAPAPEPATSADLGDDHRFGTVGVVALDTEGRIAAGTSTGGTTAKRWGRIGDAPVIGAGTWAGRGCAVSATGTGEYFIRLTVARDICSLHELNDMLLAEATEAVIGDVGSIGGDGGVIALAEDGSIAFSMNTSGMYRGWADQDSPPSVAIYADEDIQP